MLFYPRSLKAIKFSNGGGLRVAILLKANSIQLQC